MNLEDALAQLNTHQDPEKAAQSATYHKAPRPYLGVANPIINDLTKEWRTKMDVEERVDLADALWETEEWQYYCASYGSDGYGEYDEEHGTGWMGNGKRGNGGCKPGEGTGH